MLYLSLCLVGDFQRFIETMRGIQGALIVAAGFQMLMGFLGIWRNAVRYCYPWLKVFSMALPLVESINSELNLKAIFRYGRFRDANNNQQMASSCPCADPISMGT
jgi:hypothetical protein